MPASDRSPVLRRAIVVASVVVGILLGVAWWCSFVSPPAPAAQVTRGNDADRTVPGVAPRVDPLPPSRDVGPSASAGPVHTLRIVDEHGAPVADALVAVTPQLPERAMRPPLLDVEASFAELPQVRSGADGHVGLPDAAQGERFVMARAGTRFGSAVLRFDPLLPPPELVIAPVRHVQVRVVGPDARPRAGVPLAVRWRSFASPLGDHFDEVRSFSDANGLVAIRHAQALVHWDPADAVLELAAVVLGAESEVVRLPLRETGGGIVDVPCAAHGSLRVLARLPDGSPLPWRLRCEVAAASDRSEHQSVDGVDGEVRVPAVAVGREWSIRCEGFEPRTCRGPERDGEEVVVTLPLAAGQGLATARLLWPDGAAAADREFTIGVGSSWHAAARSDSAGRVVFLAPDPRWQATFSTSDPVARGSAIVPEPSQSDGRVDLGDVVLQHDAVMVAGSIVDATTGEPVEARLLVDGPVGWDCGTTSSFQLWFHGHEPDGDVSIFASRDGYRSTKVRVPCGTVDARVALQREPWRRVTVLTDADVTSWALDFDDGDGETVKPLAKHARRGAAFFTLPAPDDAHRSATLVLRGCVRGPALAEIHAGQWIETDDGAVATVDLRGRVQNVHTVATRGGEPVPLRKLFVRMPDGAWVDLAGDWNLLVADAGATFPAIALSPHGFPVRATVTTGTNVLDLPPPATIVVQADAWPDDVRGRVHLCQRTWEEPLLHELAAADALPQHLRPRAPESDSKRPSPSDVTRPIGPDTTFAVVCSGRYRIVLWVIGDDGEHPLPDAAVEVDVTTPGQRIDVTLRVDPDRVRAAVRGR